MIANGDRSPAIEAIAFGIGLPNVEAGHSIQMARAAQLLGHLQLERAATTPSAGSTPDEQRHFIGTLMYNTIFWTMVCNASMFFICVTTMAMGGWQVALRRVPEAISSVVPVLGIIAFAVLMAIVFGGRTDIYPWLDKAVVAKDHILNGKKGSAWDSLAEGIQGGSGCRCLGGGIPKRT